MNKLPRWYDRTKGTLHTFKELSDIKDCSKVSENVQPTLNLIKRIFVGYWKILCDLLKEDGIIEYYPRKILKFAVEKRIIDESKLVWINYIDLLNQLLYDSGCNTEDVKLKIIDEYLPEAEKLYGFVKNLHDKINPQDYIQAENQSLPMNSPVYQSDELGIYESSYSILINFLKNTPEIENVWLHGSRAIGTANSNSDIDMLVDSPNDSFEILKNKIKNIRMPYRIDIVNIHETSQADFIRQVTPYTKIVYRKKDFVQA